MPPGDQAKRLKGLEDRMSALETKIDKILDSLPSISSTESELSQQSVQVHLLKENLDEITPKVDSHDSALESMDKDIEELKTDMNEAQQVHNKSQHQMHFIEALRIKTKEMNNHILELESYSRRDNLIFDGVEESPQENCFHTMFNIFENLMGIANARDFIWISRCHRLHPNQWKPGQPRPMIVRFHYYPDKVLMWKSRFNLKGTNIFVREDFPGIIDNRRRSMQSVYMVAREIDRKCFVIGDQLIFKGKRYSLENLPSELVEANLGVNKKGNHIRFGGRVAFLSNFHYSPFELDGFKYTGVEQYYQSAKATYAGHHDKAALIMLEDEPIIQKRIGDSIKVNPAWYEEAGLGKMKKAQKAKFSQNKHLLNKFKNIYKDGDIFVECSYDTFWGNGVPFTHKNLNDTKNWKGKNMMGACLLEVAKSII